MKSKMAHFVAMPSFGVTNQPHPLDEHGAKLFARVDKNHWAASPQELCANQESNGFQRIIRIKEVMEITGLRRAKLYALQAEGLFPMRIQLTKHSVGWLVADVQKWISGRVADSLPLRIAPQQGPRRLVQGQGASASPANAPPLLLRKASR